MTLSSQQPVGATVPLKTAFPSVLLAHRRSLDKPRRSDLTMVTDCQMPIEGLARLLDLARAYIDIFKVATGTLRLILGGQMQKDVIHTTGIDAFPAHPKEARDVGSA